MTWILAVLLALPAAAVPRTAERPSVKLIAYDPSGKLLGLSELLAFIGRADRDVRRSGLMATAPDEMSWARCVLSEKDHVPTLSWERFDRIHITLPWPVRDDGFSTVWLDKEGAGFGNGDEVRLNEEIAVTQYRRFKESRERRMNEGTPIYKPGVKAREAAQRAQALMAQAYKENSPVPRARAFDAALQAVSLAWQHLLTEHGRQIALAEKDKSALRFGLTIDEAIFQRLNRYERLIAAIRRSRADSVRLVFRSNPDDFTYAHLSSFNEYDSIVQALEEKNLRVLGVVLETGAWPRTLTPAVYAERVKNLALHYKGRLHSWEVGSELNGDWLGGAKNPLTPEKVFAIYCAGAAKAKAIDPSLETVASLYWWSATAPDEEHALSGWLKRYVPQGFGKDLDVVAVSLQPDEAPVGMAFEGLFDLLRRQLPSQRLMLGNLGYAEEDKVAGYWWFKTDDIPAARQDLLAFSLAATCAMPKSLGGGYWWQSLEQLLPGQGSSPELYGVYAKTLRRLGR